MGRKKERNYIKVNMCVVQGVYSCTAGQWHKFICGNISYFYLQRNNIKSCIRSISHGNGRTAAAFG